MRAELGIHEINATNFEPRHLDAVCLTVVLRTFVHRPGRPAPFPSVHTSPRA